MPLPRSIETIIQEALARGEFDNLPGAGKPLDLSAYFDTPEEIRVAYSIMKNANILPLEAELLKEIAVLKEELEACTNPADKKKIHKAIVDRLLTYNVMVEKRK